MDEGEREISRLFNFDNTALGMLAIASSQSNAGGSLWYGSVQSTQELAKDAFDAINNEKVFAP